MTWLVWIRHPSQHEDVAVVGGGPGQHLLLLVVLACLISGCDDPPPPAPAATDQSANTVASHQPVEPSPPPPRRRHAIEQVFSDPQVAFVDAAVSGSGQLLTLWWGGGGCTDGKGGQCRQAYVLREPDGTTRTFGLPREPLYQSVLGAAKGFVLVRSLQRGWIIRPDGALVRWQTRPRPAKPTEDTVIFPFLSRRPRALDVSTATASQMPPLPGEAGQLQIAPDGTRWAVVAVKRGFAVAWSSDQGATWERRRFLPHAEFRYWWQLLVGPDGQAAALTLLYSPVWPPGTEVLSMDVSDHHGATWQRVERFPFGETETEGIAATAKGTVLVVDSHGRLWRSNESWTSFYRDRSAPRLGTLDVTGDYIYSVNHQHPTKVWISADDGVTWRARAVR